MTTLRQPRVALGWLVFLLIAVAGLFYVKWFPYYNRAFVAASQHSIGKSILMGASASAPEPSWQAALDYAMAYGKAIWQAMVLGLLLGSAVQALIPPQWVARALGQHSFGSVINGGLMSLPGMMCTCCAAPVVAGLRARQAAPGAAIAFWLGNTVLNPAALVFMGFVLGWQWTGLRLVLGVLMVFGLGYAVNRMVTPAQATASREALAKLIEEDEPGTAFSRWIKILGRMTLRLVPSTSCWCCCWARRGRGSFRISARISVTARCGSSRSRWRARCSSFRRRAKCPSSRRCCRSAWRPARRARY